MLDGSRIEKEKMKKMKNIFLLLGLGVLLMMQSCYDEYQTDYEFSATYFPRQYPLRTLIATNDSADLTFEVGVVIAGKRIDNLGSEKVSFRIAPELVDSMVSQYPNIKLLPEHYYSMSNDSEFDIVKGEGTRLSTQITLDKDSFVNDPNAMLPIYALPFEITAYDTDSVLLGQDFSIVMVRYYNEYHGDYFIRGVDYTMNADGSIADEFRYGKDDDVVINDWTNTFETEAFQMNSVNYVGRNITTDNDTYAMNVEVREDGFCVISGNVLSELNTLVGSGAYNTKEREFILEYTYFDDAGLMHEVFDTAYYLNTRLYDEAWYSAN